MEQLFRIDSIDVRTILSLIETSDKSDRRPILTGLHFYRNEDNKLSVVSTDSAVLARTIIDNATLEDNFTEIVICAESLKILKDYKKYPLTMVVYRDNNECVMELNGEKHFVKIIDGVYPKTSGIKMNESDSNYTISLSKNVLEKLLKVVKASENECIELTFDTTKKYAPFGAKPKGCGVKIEMIATPVITK